MKILCIDISGFFVDFAMRAEAQGHEVKVWMAPEEKTFERCTSGDGLVNKVANWKSWMNWADLVMVSDNCRYVKQLESYRKQGYPIFAACEAGVAWEMDRDVGQQVLESCGIECLPNTRFTKYDDAMKHQAANRDIRYVCKPCTDADKSLSYVSKSHKDMQFMLQHWKKNLPNPAPFIFQEFCPGIEVAVGGWVGRNGFLSHYLENFEFKKLMNGEKGPNTGEQGTAMKYVPRGESKLGQELLDPLEMELVRIGYTGYIDVAVMMGTEGARKGKLNPLEFTSRHGWPLFNIQQVLHPDVAGWMADAMHGMDTFTPSPDIAIGVVIAMPDYPNHFMKTEELSGFPIWGITEKNRYNVHPFNMKLGKGINEKGSEEPMMVSAGNCLCVVTGTGKTVETAKMRAYKNVDMLEVPNSPMYRTDIGDRLEKQLPELQKYGYCTSWIY
jgi:phosphoribosylamine---glycine ligase